MNKDKIAAKLRRVFESQRFADFYSGPMDKAITGEYPIHSEEQRENEERVKWQIESIINEILQD